MGGCLSCFGFGGCECRFGLYWGGQGLLGLRAGLGCLPHKGEGLCGIVLLIGSLNWTVFMVFLKPLGGELLQRGEVHCDKVIRGSWKVTCLTVFLKLPGLGELGMVMVLICDCAVKLGTLNSKIPKYSDAAYYNGIWGLVVSLNT